MSSSPSSLDRLQQATSDCNAAILYDPLTAEPDYRDASFPLIVPTNHLILPTDKRSDPFDRAATCIKRFANDRPFLLIPGRRFDLHGTRHGKGRGWYDRFLSRVPRTWLRIGIADAMQISSSPLTRNSWDEPMDWILISDTTRWRAYQATAKK